MSIYCIGDMHGMTRGYGRMVRRLHKEDPNAVTLQVGDMGIGFKGVSAPECGPNDFWIAGNHDDPDQCMGLPGYLGGYGTKDLLDQKVFWCGGAMSTDRARRVEGETWWAGEEQTYQQLSDAVALYEKVKPDIMISHDCPEQIRNRWFAREGGRTVQALTRMFELHQPRFWAFGHHHTARHEIIEGTCFLCLEEAQCKKLSDKFFRPAYVKPTS